MASKYIIVGVCAVVCVAALAQAQYNTYDSDSNSDSDENPILAKTELGNLVRKSAKQNNAAAAAALRNLNSNSQYQQQLAAATRNLYNRQQPLQYAPTQNNRRQFGGDLQAFGPMMGAANARGGGYSNANANNNDDDDGESSNYGPNFNGNGNANNNDDDGEGSGAEGGSQPLNLNQAASGYPGQGDYSSNDAAGAGFNFGGVSGYGPSADGSEFGPSSDAFSGEGRRQKSASAPRGYGSDDELAGALQYGPNSAINAGGDGEEDSRAGYAPEGQNDNNDDDE